MVFLSSVAVDLLARRRSFTFVRGSHTSVAKKTTCGVATSLLAAPPESVSVSPPCFPPAFRRVQRPIHENGPGCNLNIEQFCHGHVQLPRQREQRRERGVATSALHLSEQPECDD